MEKKEWVKTMKAYYQKAATIFSDYRHYVPSYAPAALTFYLIILIVPAISIVPLRQVYSTLIQICLSIY